MDDQQAGGTGHDQGRGETELRKADRSLRRPSRSFQGGRAFNRGQALGLREPRRVSQNPTRDRAEKFSLPYFLVQPPYPEPSTKTSSRVLLKAGISTLHIAKTASPSKVALIGRWTNTHGFPRESNIARRRYSSINGPRMKASSMGAGSQPSLENK